jgi:pentatricopeptide repeat protein
MTFNSLIEGYCFVGEMGKAFGIVHATVPTGVGSGVVRVIHFMMPILEM